LSFQEEGSPRRLVHQLRDPSIFRDNDGKIYLLYSGLGENGIGIAELEIKTTNNKI
jgi:beta-xylosidase